VANEQMVSKQHQAAANDIAVKHRAFENAFREKNAMKLVESYFVEDALKPMSSPPGVPPIVGRGKIAVLFAEQFVVADAIHLETIDLTVAESQAYELGRAHLTLKDGSKVFGRYAVLWVKAGGEWRVRIDFFGPDGWQ